MKAKRDGGTWFQNLKTRNKILLCTALFELLFILTMELDFIFFRSIPDTLCNCVLGAGGVVELMTGGISIVELLKKKGE